MSSRLIKSIDVISRKSCQGGAVRFGCCGCINWYRSGTLYDGNERVIGYSVGRTLNSMVSTGDSTGVENGLLDARRSRFVDFGDGVG